MASPTSARRSTPTPSASTACSPTAYPSRRTEQPWGAASYRSLPLIGKKIDKYPIGRQINKYIYQRRAMKLNPIFRERLGWLYDRLAKTLAHALRAPTRYPDDLALPGFHVNQEAIREKTVGPFRTGP